MIIRVSVVIVDGVRWKQNVGMLVWFGGNVLRCPVTGDWARCCVVVDHSQGYANGLALTWRMIFLPMSMGSQLGGQIWNLIPLGFCREECHESGGEL